MRAICIVWDPSSRTASRPRRTSRHSPASASLHWPSRIPGLPWQRPWRPAPSPPRSPHPFQECAPTTAGCPAFCRVAATISPVPGSTIKIEVWLPVEGWNGKFVGVGNGGFSGEICYFAMAEPLAAAMRSPAPTPATKATRPTPASRSAPGEAGRPRLARRARDDGQVEGNRHRALRPRPRGTPTGSAARPAGRQGLKEAQRFPADYDGISAGAPANNWVPLMAYGAKVQQVIANPTGVHAEQLALLKEAAIAACDTSDGVTDRVVEDPRSCTFDPGALAVHRRQLHGCLTARQVEAARSIYAGVVNPRTGETHFSRAQRRRRDSAWVAYAPAVFPIGANYLRDLVMRDATWTSRRSTSTGIWLARCPLDQGRARLDECGSRRLRRPRRKAAALARLDRRHDPAQNTIDYYEKVLADDRSQRPGPRCGSSWCPASTTAPAAKARS